MSTAAIITGIDLLLQLIDRTSAAGAIIRKAREEGREPSAEELQAVKAQGVALDGDLDAAIARAKAEGR